MEKLGQGIRSDNSADMTDVALPPVFTLTQAVTAGTRARLRTACRTHRVVTVGRSCYALPETVQNLQRSRGGRLQLTAMTAVAHSRRPVWASHHSALALHGLPTGRSTPARAIVTMDESHGVVHRANDHDAWPAKLPLLHRDSVRGIPTVTAARAAVDTCRHADVADAVIVGDAALHRHATTPAKIDEAFAYCAGWPGIRRARRAAQHFDGSRESPLESLSFAAFIELGLPLPTCQVTLVDHWGDSRGTVDFYWHRQRVIGEADGDVKYRDNLPGAVSANTRLLAEKRRQILDAFARSARLFG